MRSDAKASGRAREREGTPAKAVYDRLFVEPPRFRGDLQARTGTKNLHRRLARFVEDTAEARPVLDLGSGNRKLASWVTSVDMVDDELVDVVADVTKLPFPDEFAGAAVLQQVLEHVERPEDAVAELARVLKPSALAYVEVPFIFPVHDSSDFSRWTQSGLHRLLEPLEVLEMGVSMGPISAMSTVIHRVLTLRARRLVTEAALSILVSWFLAPLRLLDRLLPPSPSDHLAAGAVYAIVRKPSAAPESEAASG